MKTVSPENEQKPHKIPKKKKSLLELAKESPAPKELRGLINILAPYELRKSK